jgi:hypothetical protein
MFDFGSQVVKMFTVMLFAAHSTRLGAGCFGCGNISNAAQGLCCTAKVPIKTIHDNIKHAPPKAQFGACVGSDLKQPWHLLPSVANAIPIYNIRLLSLPTAHSSKHPSHHFVQKCTVKMCQSWPRVHGTTSPPSVAEILEEHSPVLHLLKVA